MYFYLIIFNANIDFIVVGLGNPGSKYQRTRHNAGFEAVDLLCQKLGGDRMKKSVYGNVSDDRVEDYNYDYYFCNDKTLDEAEADFCAFLRGVMEE